MAKQKKVVIIKAVHPDKEIEARFEGAKTSDIVDWLFELSKTLTRRNEPVPKLKWVPAGFMSGMKEGRFSNAQNSGYLYGLTIYILNKNEIHTPSKKTRKANPA